MTIELKEFDVRQLNYHPTIIIIGQRATGKSYLARDLLVKQYNNSKSLNVVVSYNEINDGFYKECIPNLQLYDNYHPSIIKSVLNINPDESCIVLDNCLFDNTDWIKDNNIKHIFINGRILKTTLIITMQYELYIPHVIRSNIDYIFIMKNMYIPNKLKLFKNYGSMFPTFESFRQVMDKYTEDFGCLVIKNCHNSSNKIEDKVFWYKVQPNITQEFESNITQYLDTAFGKRKLHEQDQEDDSYSNTMNKKTKTDIY